MVLLLRGSDLEKAAILAAMKAMEVSFSNFHQEMVQCLSEIESKIAIHTHTTSLPLFFQQPLPTKTSSETSSIFSLSSATDEAALFPPRQNTDSPSDLCPRILQFPSSPPSTIPLPLPPQPTTPTDPTFDELLKKLEKALYVAPVSTSVAPTETTPQIKRNPLLSSLPLFFPNSHLCCHRSRLTHRPTNPTTSPIFLLRSTEPLRPFAFAAQVLRCNRICCPPPPSTQRPCTCLLLRASLLRPQPVTEVMPATPAPAPPWCGLNSCLKTILPVFYGRAILPWSEEPPGPWIWGFGSCLLSMYEKIYKLTGEDNPGNHADDVKNPGLLRMMGFMFVVRLLGLFSLVPLRKVMVLDYKLTYPSGTARVMMINSFHTHTGAELARKHVTSLGKDLGISYFWSFFKWLFSGAGGSCGFDNFLAFGLAQFNITFYVDFSPTYVGCGLICPHMVKCSVLLWPFISTKAGDWYLASLGNNDFKGLYGYKGRQSLPDNSTCVSPSCGWTNFPAIFMPSSGWEMLFMTHAENVRSWTPLYDDMSGVFAVYGGWKVELIKKGNKVDFSKAALLSKLSAHPFSSGLVVISVYIIVVLGHLILNGYCCPVYVLQRLQECLLSLLVNGTCCCGMQRLSSNGSYQYSETTRFSPP